MIYLQNLLKRSDTELVNKVYMAQKNNTTKGDFAELVKKDLDLYDIDLKDEDIEKMTIHEYKNHIKNKVFS